MLHRNSNKHIYHQYFRRKNITLTTFTIRCLMVPKQIKAIVNFGELFAE